MENDKDDKPNGKRQHANSAKKEHLGNGTTGSYFKDYHGWSADGWVRVYDSLGWLYIGVEAFHGVCVFVALFHNKRDGEQDIL